MLMIGASFGQRQVVLACLQHRQANLDLQDRQGKTALELACHKGHKEIVLDLVGAGARVNLRNNFGCAALVQTPCRGHIALVAALRSPHAVVGPEIGDND